MDTNTTKVRAIYIIGMIIWGFITLFSFPISLVLNPLVVLVSLIGFFILFVNYINVCDETVGTDNWVVHDVPIYMGFAIITLFLTIYRFSDIKDPKIYKTFIMYIVLSMVLLYIPITNVCFGEDQRISYKVHIDNIMSILSIGILIYLMAIASTFPMKPISINQGDEIDDLFAVML